MKLLITGAKGFIGKNLVATLQNIQDGKDKSFGIDPDLTVYVYDLDTPKEKLDDYVKDCEFVFHLAGVNRPETEAEFMEGNFGFAETLLQKLKLAGNKAPVLVTSSIQAELENPYGKSKKAGEDLIRAYGEAEGVKTLIYRLPNVFGKWCRPNYNSAVATFCHNIANDLEIQVNDPAHEMQLVYVDDVVKEFLSALMGKEHRAGDLCYVPTLHRITLGEIVNLLTSFKEQPKTLQMPEIPKDSFAKKLYSTYLSYLPERYVRFPLKMNTDERGSFTELLKTEHCGQFSVNISKPGITKGQHWHHTKWEFFMVVAGHGLIQERQIGTEKVLNFEVSGEKIEAIHMLPGYTHNIINLSESEDLVTLMWANEQFDGSKPDTYYEEV